MPLSAAALRDEDSRDGRSRSRMEVVGGGAAAPNAGALPIDIPFAKTVGEPQPSHHAEPFLRSTHTHMHMHMPCTHTRTRARTHTHI